MDPAAYLPGDTELVALFLAVLVGAVLLIASLAALLTWVGRGLRGSHIPRITPLDDQVGEMWARQVQMRRPFVRDHRQAA